MDTPPELILKPNYPGLLVTGLLMGAGGYLCFRLVVLFGAGMPITDLTDRLIQVSMIALMAIILAVCLASLLDCLRTALTGLRRDWQVRITGEGIHHPLLSPRFIPWQSVEAISVARGYNGKDIWFTLEPPVRPAPMFSGFISLLARRRVSYLRLLAHKFEIDTLAFLRTLNALVPERLGVAYRID